MTDSSSYDNAAMSAVASRMVELDLARLAATSGDDTHADVFHAWLQGLPLPVKGTAVRPLLSLGVSLDATASRVRFSATGATGAMIEPTAAFFTDVDATEAALADIQRLGASIEPDALASWLEMNNAALNAGWEMSGRMDASAAWDAVDDRRRRRTLTRFVGRHDASRLVTVGRSVGSGSVTTRLRIEIGSAADDDDVAAATELMADLDGPMIADDVLGALLAEAGHRALTIGLWLLGDGLARVGFSVTDAPMALVVRLASDGGWVDALERVAAVQGAIDAEHPSCVECFVDASGAGTDLGYAISLS